MIVTYFYASFFFAHLSFLFLAATSPFRSLLPMTTAAFRCLSTKQTWSDGFYWKLDNMLACSPMFCFGFTFSLYSISFWIWANILFFPLRSFVSSAALFFLFLSGQKLWQNIKNLIFYFISSHIVLSRVLVNHLQVVQVIIQVIHVKFKLLLLCLEDFNSINSWKNSPAFSLIFLLKTWMKRTSGCLHQTFGRRLNSFASLLTSWWRSGIKLGG